MSREYIVGSVHRRGQQNTVFATLVGLTKRILKSVFRQYLRIRCIYESLRCLDLWSAIVNKIHDCIIASMFPHMISTSRSLMFMDRSSMSMFLSWIAMFSGGFRVVPRVPWNPPLGCT